ncbi:hypothetical protein P879_09485 [Paragonimus westermani]|uniref:Uncharacterized protein n=1 Tax=Paragonimus westermani TaxID=34504 RepID=A0A8T0DB32_9TREM|nr:hypothetical protein P879_09485 [Paragonimus westermani]
MVYSCAFYNFSSYSLFLFMEKGIKTKLKEAKRLYQQSDFVSCRELLEELLNVDRKNYNALVLNGACCDHLGLEDIGVDYFYDAIHLEPNNVLAWQGLFQLSTKNTDRYHASLVCVCMKLLQFYDSPEYAEKKTTCGRILIELLVRYRLELPDGLCNLEELCRFVLKSAPSNSFALELSIRLKVEKFLFVGLPHLISPTLLDAPLKHHEFSDIVDQLLDPETSTQVDELMDSVKRLGEIGSKTAAATARLGTMVVATARLLSEPNKHTRTGWQSLFEQINMVEINGCRGLTNWLQRGYMDLHVICLHAVVAYRLHLFDHCEMVLGKILAYCSEKKPLAAEEARRLSFFPTTPLSQLDGFLTPRPMCTPIQSVPSDFSLNLSGTFRSMYDLVEQWAINLRLANAAASEQVSFASRLALEFTPSCDKTHKSTFLWSNVMRTLLVECCLTGRHLERAFRTLCPAGWDDLNLDTIRALVLSNSDQSAVRLRLCSLWATTEFILRSSTACEQTQLVLAEIDVVAHTVGESLQTVCSARDQFLLARLFSLLDLAAGGCLQDVSKMVQMEHYEAGVAADEAYYANYLCLGKLHRDAGNVK